MREASPARRSPRAAYKVFSEIVPDRQRIADKCCTHWPRYRAGQLRCRTAADAAFRCRSGLSPRRPRRVRRRELCRRPPARPWPSPAATAPANPRCCAPIAGLVRLAAGRLALEGGDPELTIAEQAHYLGHQDALKPSLSVGENLRFWAGFFGAKAADIAGRSMPSGSTRWPTCRPPTCPPGSAGGCRSPGCLPVKRPIWLLDEPTSTLDAPAQERLAGLMRAHLAGRRPHPRRHPWPDRARSQTRELRLDRRRLAVEAEPRS